jgi:hypothetical protein
MVGIVVLLLLCTRSPYFRSALCVPRSRYPNGKNNRRQYVATFHRFPGGLDGRQTGSHGIPVDKMSFMTICSNKMVKAHATTIQCSVPRGGSVLSTGFPGDQNDDRPTLSKYRWNQDPQLVSPVPVGDQNDDRPTLSKYRWNQDPRLAFLVQVCFYKTIKPQTSLNLCSVCVYSPPVFR